MIRFERPAPGASAEERARVYADALLGTETALNEFKDELSRHTEELIVRHNLAEKEKERLENRLDHIETMLEAVMRALSLDPKTGLPALPAMRDKAVTQDDIEEAVEKGVERAIERKTPATAFAVPGFNPWQAPPAPRGITSERAKELVEGASNSRELLELKTAADKRADMYRNIVIGVCSAVGGAGVIWAIVELVQAAGRSSGHAP